MAKKYKPCILILYSSRFGQCQRIAQTMAAQLEVLGNLCEVINLEEAFTLAKPIGQYESVIITASIRYGYYHSKVKSFVQEHKQALEEVLDVFVPVNLIARKPEKRSLETNVYARKFLEKTSWKPKILSIMPGALRYPLYNAIDRFMIQLIMKMSKGETDASKDIDYTDWEEVRALARRVDKELRDKRLSVLFPKQEIPQLSYENTQETATA